jgi:hypothetical protein
LEPTPTIQPETATPIPTEAPDDDAIAGESPSIDWGPQQLVSPQVLDVQLSALQNAAGELRVRGTVSVSYRIVPSAGGTVSVLFTVEQLETGSNVIVPGDVVLIGVGALSSADPEAESTGCVPLPADALPRSLATAAPIVSCTPGAGGVYEQELTFEFPADTAVTPDDYRGAVSLTMALAP